MYKRVNRDLEKRHLMGCMVGLMQQLEKLSPHPDCPSYRGALFTALPSWCKAPSQHDGMGGQILLQGLLGGAFAQAVSAGVSESAGKVADIGNLASSALEAYEFYKSETESERQHKAAHGQGTYARVAGTSIAKKFNVRGTISAAMQAFLDDMPFRLKIERQLAALLKNLKALDAPVYAAQLKNAA